MATKKTKKEESLEEDAVEETSEEVAPATPRIQHDYLRQDLNELRDVVNELWASRG